MSPKTENSSTGPRHDALRDIYLDAVQGDVGPSAQSSERILAHARAGAGRAGSRGEQGASTASQTSVKAAANDRFWLRQAVASVAAIGLVGWLVLQHMAGWDDAGKREADGFGSGTAVHEPARAATEESTNPAAGAALSAENAPPAAAPRADAARSRMTAPMPASPEPSSAPPLAQSAGQLADQSATSVVRPEAKETRSAKQSRQEAQLPLCPEEQAPPAAVQAEKVTPSAAAASADMAAKVPAQTPAVSKGNSGSESSAPACRPRLPAVKTPTREPGKSNEAEADEPESGP